MRKVAGSLVLLAVCALAVQAPAQVVTLPAGTTLQVELEKSLNTKDSKAGDAFRSHLVMPVFVNEEQVLPVGCIVEGTVQRVQAPGRASKKAEMQLRPEKMTLPSGEVLTITAGITGGQGDDKTKITGEEGTIQASGKEGMDTKGVATTATTGAVLGAVMAGGEGALIGAGAVAAIAVIHQIFKKGYDAALPAGSELILELNRPVSFNPTMQEVAPKEKTGSGDVDSQRDQRPVLSHEP